jgi:hypothetical protein
MMLNGSPDKVKGSDIDVWGYFLFEAWATPKIYLLVLLCSVVAVFLKENVSWYYALLPMGMYLLTKSMQEEYLDRMMLAVLPIYTEEFMAKSENPKQLLDLIDDIRNEKEPKTRELQFLEMFQKPPTLLQWIIFIVIKLLRVVQILAIIGWSVLASLTFLKLLMIFFASSIILYPLDRIYGRALLKRALERWTVKHMADLNSNLSLKSQLLSRNNIKPENFPAWLQSEMVRLYEAGIHPDLFRFGERTDLPSDTHS